MKPMRTSGRYSKGSWDLFKQALEKIPAYSPEWTNHNPSDAGITLAELFAWLTDSILYRAGQTPKEPKPPFRKIATLARRRVRRQRVLILGKSRLLRAAPVRFLAGKLGRKLYRVDLSEVVDKFIGETEKNLGRIFERAEASDSILFFDEADAIFGKRSEVKDSHDRFANVEAGRLVQMFEEFEGVAILATGRCDEVDLANLRRRKWMVYSCEPTPRTVIAASRKPRGSVWNTAKGSSKLRRASQVRQMRS